MAMNLSVLEEDETHVSCIVPMHDASPERIDALRSRLPSRISELFIVISNSCCQYAQRKAVASSTHILELPYQVGKQEAYLTALENVLTSTQSNIIVQTDGRFKQPPEEIDALLDQILHAKCEMVLADRYAKQTLQNQPHRDGITKMLSSLLSTVTPFRVVDASCGTRVYTIKAAAAFLNMHGFGYGLEVEQILICALHRFTILSVPVSSDIQHNTTNAEKLEDSLYVLISYCRQLGYSSDIRHELCRILLNVKRRETFEVSLSVFRQQGKIKWQYQNNEGTAIVRGYTSQIPTDSYSLIYVR